MNPNAAIFLSASVPDPNRAPRYSKSADSVAIASAVGALVHVVLGRRRLVWGGHPAITPMVYAVAEGLGLNYSQWVTLYQSAIFEDRYPEDNEKFKNVIYTPATADRDSSLRLMRRQMFTDHAYGPGVFIGGMEGIVEEFHLFREMQPNARLVPVVSTGGAVLDVASELPNLSPELVSDLDYVSLLHRQLGIPTGERRYTSPENQPRELNDRLLK
jgi:hypothetical protein